MAAMIDTTMVNWAISGTVILLVVLMLRQLFGEGISRRMRYGLWLVVLVRLLVPFSFGSSGLSIQNLLPVNVVQTDENMDIDEEVNENHMLKNGIDGSEGVLPGVLMSGDTDNAWQEVPNVGQGNLQQSVSKEPQSAVQQGNGQSVNDQLINGQPMAGPSIDDPMTNGQPGQVQQDVTQNPQAELGTAENGSTLRWTLLTLLQVWRIGAVLGIVWILVVNVRFARYLKQTRCQVGAYQGMTVYTAPELVSPCLFGLWKPAIYLTAPVADREEIMFYATMHEGCHHAHGDHVWGVLRGLCLAIWWWHPLVWLAASLSRQDCELACDEACVERLGETQRQQYGMALIRSLQGLAVEAGRPYPGTAATLFSGKEELKARLQALTKRPLVRYSAIVMVTVTILVGILITFTGQVTANSEGESGHEDSLTGETNIDEIYIKEPILEDNSEEKPMDESFQETQPSGLTDTVQIYTHVFPWESTDVRETPEQGVEIRQLAVPVFAEDCRYYINKIHYDNHGIDYQEADEQSFLTTVEGMEAKGYGISLEVVYEQDQIVEAYLKSDQDVRSNMNGSRNSLAWDPMYPPYADTGLEAYTLEREYKVDISAAEGVETIGIYTLRINDGYEAVLVVHDTAGDILYAKSISTHKKEREGIFLVEQDGIPALLWWEASQRYDVESAYNYRVFRLDETGTPVQSEGAGYSCLYLRYRGGRKYDPSQLQLWAQPIYDKYLKQADFLAGFDRQISDEVYYEIPNLEAYHYTTLQAETMAAHEAYWYDSPGAMYENPDFEEYATIQDLFEENNRLWMQLQGKERNASVSSDCQFYVRQEIDQYPYEEVERKAFMQILKDRGEVHALCQYENGWVTSVFLEGSYAGVRFINPFYQDQDGCRYTQNISSHPDYGHTQYNWSEYQLEVQYEADVSDHEGMERIMIYSGFMRDMPTEHVALLKVESADGQVLFLDELDHFGLNKTSYYLGERDGQAYLVLLYLEDRYHHGEFHYSAFRLDKGNTQLSGCLFDWSVDRLDDESVFPEDEFLLWASKAHHYLEGAECILHADNSGSSQFFYEWDGAIDWQVYGEEIAARE